MISGIVVALPEELATLTSKRIDKGHSVFIANKLLVAYSGTGHKNAQSAAELLIAKGVTQLISWGCAAALDASLKSGDLTLADTLVGSDDMEIAINTDWHRYSKGLLSQSLAVHTGRLAESLSIVSSSKEKQQLQAITGAIALDMESVAVARIAQRNAVPFLAIRAIVDPVTMDLPHAIEYAANGQGDIVLSRLLLFLMLHPLELPGLIKLGWQFNAAKKTLKKVARHLNGISEFYHTQTAVR
ncbi:MAG: phosphorylase [Methylovulum sp.]|uniref:phosphorylase family protein n=1 Tax=Methylovulum sp. TaxID=1916980 RepID=UPI00262D7201|nr:phosphorylase [Methylovulum sp.]MDD2725177.1 phosphorylase [Methylovulum sp.]MDD5124390.1 phosphorylase [Methylovulum sp.]